MHGFTNYLEVVFLDVHLEVKAYEFTQVAMSERILSPKHWSNLKNVPRICTNGHLLVRLWRLCKTCSMALIV